MNDKWPIIAMGIGGIALSSILWQWPTVHNLEAWHWRMRITELRWELIPFALGIPIAFTWVLIKWRLPIWSRWFLLLALGWSSQWLPSWLEKDGLYGFRHQLSQSGHNEFAWTGSRGFEANQVIERYDEFIEQIPNQRFSKSKPPGTIATHIWLSDIANKTIKDDIILRAPIDRTADLAHRKTVELLAWLLPVLAALALWPLWSLSEKLMPETPWFVPCAFALSPAFCLITMHFDQAVYPIIAIGAWATSITGSGPKHALLAGFGAGLLLWLGLFLSFSLLPAGLMTLVWMWAMKSDSIGWRIGGMVASLCLCTFIATIAWGYDPITRYTAVMANHVAWKQWSWTPKNMRVSLTVNAIETLWWLGPPLAIAFLVGCKKAIINRKETMPIDRLTMGTMTTLLILLFSSRTFGEVARLWFYLSPVLLFIGGNALIQATEKKSWSPFYWLVFSALWTIAFKIGQDFW